MSASSAGDLDATRTSIVASGVLAPGTVLAGRYQIVELVGVGAMGMVYRALDGELGIEVAVKLLRLERTDQELLRQRFRQELILARQVSHRNVVRIHDIGQDGERTFLTMDYVPGRSLRRSLEEEGRFGLDKALDIARQLAAALAAAHREGVVHRDLKPANVLLDAAGRAYVTDFGIARSRDGRGLTATGSVVGTPDYLAPEQAKGEPVDHRADLYALGLVLFEMLTGVLPFSAETLDELLAQRITGRPRSLRQAGVEAPRHVEVTLARCLERDPRRRYASADELAADLAVEPGAGRGPAASLAAGLRGLTRRPAARWAATLVAFTAVAALSWVRPWRFGDEVTAAPRHSVAVLPLADETGRPDLAWIASGVAEMVAASLAESPALAVTDSLRVSRTLQDLKLPPGPLPEADLKLLGELLDVDRLVVGRVRSAAGRVRIDASLLSTSGPGRLVDRVEAESASVDSVFELIGRVASGLRERLEVEPGAVAPATRSAEALQAYTGGLEHLGRGDGLAAAPAFERAVAVDDSFGDAWLRLASAYRGLGYREKAQMAAGRAVELLGREPSRAGFEARAIDAELRGDLDGAMAILRQQLERFPNDTQARLELAGACGDAGQLQEAVAMLEEVTRADPNHPRAWYLLGRYALKGGDSRRAFDDYLVRALVVQKRLGNERGQAEVENALGAAAEKLGLDSQAREHYQTAAETRERIGDHHGLAASLANLAALEAKAGEYRAAEAHLERALALRREIGDVAGLANLENQLGTLAERQGQYRAALDHFRNALQARRELGDPRALAESAGNVGFAYYVLGELDNAEAYQQQALDLFRQAQSAEGELYTQQNLAQIELVRGRWPAAIERLLAALDSSRSLGRRDGEALSQGLMGRVAQLQGRYAAALQSYRQASKLLADLDNPAGMVEYTLFEAETLLEVGDLESAAEPLRRARGWLEAGPNREQQAELERLEGMRLLALGRAAEAGAVLRRARTAAQESGSRLAGLATDIAVGEQLLAAGEARQARAQLATAVAEAERIGHAVLELAGRAALARAEGALGRRREAEAEIRRALAEARNHAPYAGAWKLHLALADLLAGRGEAAEARAEQARAQAELERLGADLEASQRAAIDRLAQGSGLAG